MAQEASQTVWERKHVLNAYQQEGVTDAEIATLKSAVPGQSFRIFGTVVVLYGLEQLADVERHLAATGHALHLSIPHHPKNVFPFPFKKSMVHVATELFEKARRGFEKRPGIRWERKVVGQHFNIGANEAQQHKLYFKSSSMAPGDKKPSLCTLYDVAMYYVWRRENGLVVPSMPFPSEPRAHLLDDERISFGAIAASANPVNAHFGGPGAVPPPPAPSVAGAGKKAELQRLYPKNGVIALDPLVVADALRAYCTKSDGPALLAALLDHANLPNYYPLGTNPITETLILGHNRMDFTVRGASTSISLLQPVHVAPIHAAWVADTVAPPPVADPAAISGAHSFAHASATGAHPFAHASAGGHPAAHYGPAHLAFPVFPGAAALSPAFSPAAAALVAAAAATPAVPPGSAGVASGKGFAPGGFVSGGSPFAPAPIAAGAVAPAPIAAGAFAPTPVAAGAFAPTPVAAGAFAPTPVAAGAFAPAPIAAGAFAPAHLPPGVAPIVGLGGPAPAAHSSTALLSEPHAHATAAVAAAAALASHASADFGHKSDKHFPASSGTGGGAVNLIGGAGAGSGGGGFGIGHTIGAAAGVGPTDPSHHDSAGHEGGSHSKFATATAPPIPPLPAAAMPFAKHTADHHLHAAPVPAPDSSAAALVAGHAAFAAGETFSVTGSTHPPTTFASTHSLSAPTSAAPTFAAPTFAASKAPSGLSAAIVSPLAGPVTSAANAAASTAAGLGRLHVSGLGAASSTLPLSVVAQGVESVSGAGAGTEVKLASLDSLPAEDPINGEFTDVTPYVHIPTLPPGAIFSSSASSASLDTSKSSIANITSANIAAGETFDCDMSSMMKNASSPVIGGSASSLIGVASDTLSKDSPPAAAAGLAPSSLSLPSSLARVDVPGMPRDLAASASAFGAAAASRGAGLGSWPAGGAAAGVGALSAAAPVVGLGAPDLVTVDLRHPDTAAPVVPAASGLDPLSSSASSVSATFRVTKDPAITAADPTAVISTYALSNPTVVPPTYALSPAAAAHGSPTTRSSPAVALSPAVAPISGAAGPGATGSGDFGGFGGVKAAPSRAPGSASAAMAAFPPAAARPAATRLPVFSSASVQAPGPTANPSTRPGALFQHLSSSSPAGAALHRNISADDGFADAPVVKAKK